MGSKRKMTTIHMASFWQDVRFSARLLKNSPLFALTVWLLLGIGIGANTLIFSAFDTLLLRALPIDHPEQLVRLAEVRQTGFATWDHPYALCTQMARPSSSVSTAICQGDLDVAFDDGAATERIRIHSVSRNFFSEMKMKALLGRVLTPADDMPSSMNAVVSYDFWQNHMQRSPNAVGHTIRLNGYALTVVGVLPQNAAGLTIDTIPQVRVSISTVRLLGKTGDKASDRLFPEVQVFARLRPGVSLARAEAELEPGLRAAYEEEWARTYHPNMPKALAESRLRLEPAGQGVSALREQFSRGLTLLMASVGLLLLLACANVAGLLLSRSAARAQEISIRAALGASRWRIARQLLTESLVLAIPGGIVGVALTYALRPVLLNALPQLRDRAAVIQPSALHLDLDLRVLAFVTAVTLLTALLCGLAPALRTDAPRASRTTTAHSYLRSALLVAQVAICVLLLAGAGVLVKTFRHMQEMDPGFDSSHIVTFSIDPGLKAYTPDRTKALSRRLLDQTRSLPGVASAAIAGLGLMRGTGVKATIGAAGKPISPADFLNCSMNVITPEYFRTMGLRILAGRDFTWFEDEKGKPRNTIVNESFLRRIFPGISAADALGKQFGYKGPDGFALPQNRIIGVVSNAKYRSLREPIPATFYSPRTGGFENDFILHLRAQGDPTALIKPVRRVLRSLDPELPFVEAAPLRQDVEATLWQERLLAWFSSILSAFAAVLAGLGLYGALEFAVRSRTREVGIRVALGAQPSAIVRLLSNQMLWLATLGSALGLYCYFLTAGWLRRLLFDVAPFDLEPLAIAIAFALLVTLVSIAIPVRRAVRIEPSSALRQE